MSKNRFYRTNIACARAVSVLCIVITGTIVTTYHPPRPWAPCRFPNTPAPIRPPNAFASELPAYSQASRFVSSDRVYHEDIKKIAPGKKGASATPTVTRNPSLAFPVLDWTFYTLERQTTHWGMGRHDRNVTSKRLNCLDVGGG